MEQKPSIQNDKDVNDTLNLDETLDLHFPPEGQNPQATDSFFRGGQNVTGNIGVLKDSYAVDESTFRISTLGASD